MLALSLAILGTPRCLLLDEPSIGLAPNLVERMFQQVREVCKSHAMTAVLVEQNVAAAMKIADRVIIMNNGQIVFDGFRTRRALRTSGTISRRHAARPCHCEEQSDAAISWTVRNRPELASSLRSSQ